MLSKDMSELVNAMKLAQSYSTTTHDNVYRKLVPNGCITTIGLFAVSVIVYYQKHN